MVNENYLLAAKSLAVENKKRLNTECSPKEQETEALFYWIINRLEWSVRDCWPAQPSHNVHIKEGFSIEDKYISLEHGGISKYTSHYVAGKEFYSVMQDVANLFNEIGEDEETGYSFKATYFSAEDENYSSLTVFMTTTI